MVLEFGRDKKPHVSVFTLNNGFGARIILEALQPYAFCLHTHGLIIYLSIYLSIYLLSIHATTLTRGARMGFGF